MMIKGKEIVLGVTGGIAVYKALEIVRGIKESGGNVTVIMTKAAMEFVQPLTFQTLSGRAVATSLFAFEREEEIGHIDISQRADLFIVAPATANCLGKAAHGIADDFLTTSLLANKAPLFLAPAMNTHMWDHPAVQENLRILRKRGVIIIPPDSGYLACGSYGTGRMADPSRIIHEVKAFDPASGNRDLSLPLKGISILVTAGPTHEAIDAVRYLSNRSSGKMGYALAAHCRDLGGAVSLISGPSGLTPPEGVNVVKVTTAEEMYRAVMRLEEESQLIIKAAAVGDFRVETPNPHKTKKNTGLTINLVKNRDILKDLGAKKRTTQFLVGFAAESQNVQEYAERKLREKNLDLIVANNILEEDAGFGVNTNRVFLIDGKSSESLPLLTKEAVSEEILQRVLRAERWASIARSTQNSGK